MADKVVQLKNKDGDNLYPVSVLPGERILWEDTLEVAPEHSEGVNDMIGATATSAGVHGLVPAPAAGDQDKVLKGDGTWASATFDDMTGATASAAGVHGLAPQPAAGDQGKALAGDGTWKEFVAYDVASGTATDMGDLYANVGANYNKILGSTAVSADDCIWTPKHLDETISAGRLVEERVFAFASMTNPITNAIVYGECKTTIYYNFSKYHAIQEFTVFQDATQANVIKFRRKWYTTANASTPSAASWTKLAWIPIEYPSSNTGIVAGKGGVGNSHWEVSGGNFKLNLRDCGYNSSSSSSIFLKLPDWIKSVSKTANINGQIQCGIIEDLNGNVRHMQWNAADGCISTYGTLTNGTQYYGSLIIPLGY